MNTITQSVLRSISIVYLLMGLLSCDKGNGNAGGFITGNSKLTKVLDIEGDLVYSASKDANGKIIKLRYYIYPWERISDTEFYSSDGKSSALLDDKGYLKAIVLDSYNGHWSENGKYTFEYDNKGYIQKINHRRNDGWEERISLIWENGNLVTFNLTNDDENTQSATISYENTKNESNQWPVSLAYEYLGFAQSYSSFIIAGYMGRCSANLPTSITYRYEKFDDEDEYYTISYGFNDDNTIMKEMVREHYEGGSDRWGYTYFYND